MTDQSLQSASWYRVAHLKPRLRSHARIHRQHFRGQLWYVLQDRTSGRFVRFTPAAYLVISLMDGHRTVQEIWDIACARLGDDVLTQDETIRLLGQLYRSDVLHGDVPPDVEELSQRGAKQRRRKLVMSMLNPMALRIPLIDPDEFLDATLPVARVFLSWGGALVFIGVVGYALILAGVYWPQLTGNLADRVLSAENLLVLLVTYPFVKALHELGHGYAVKKWGGEVHEMGIMFLVFMPVPYVDASAAAGFRSKWRRTLVGAMGILVELFLAALALFVWVNIEEGFARAIAFNVMLIGGVSTLLFNGNPLLRFDGYYVLSDLLEIPNLGNRANRYIGYLIQRYPFGVADAQSPATARGEPFWMFIYAVASFCYRMFIVVAIALFVASKFFIIGVVLALWALILMFVVPLAKQVWFLLTSPVLRRTRGRAFAACAGALATVALVLSLVPVPYRTTAEGVVWMPDEAAVHAGADGIVDEVLVEPNARVEAGAPLLRMADPLLDGRVDVLEARVAELRHHLAASDVEDRVEARIIRERLRHAEADLALARERQRALLVRSSASGRFILSRAADLPGRHFRKGAVLGYVARLDEPVIRVLVPENAADLVRQETRGIEIRFADRLHTVLPAAVVREVPSLSDTLPSMALSTMGGGEIALDPTDPQEMRALARLLHLELQPRAPHPVDALGGRVYVRFDHGNRPLVYRIYRTVRQLFLRRFNV